MKLPHHLDRGQVVVSLHVIVDIANVEQVRTELLTIIRTHQATSHACVVDLGPIPYVLPTGLSLLANLHDQCRRLDMRLRIVSDRPLVTRVLRLVGMHRILPPFRTVADALRADDVLPHRAPAFPGPHVNGKAVSAD
ncbi:STAS domain-containing protein [Embleya sp. AB8]|uniref:STAS domain-containing protein n=1 Tax=Embleya sp. AB8 TaxID=3156304 RepID=UPI003C716C3C